MIILIGFGVSLAVFLVMFWFFTNPGKHPLAAADEAKHAPKTFTISSKDIETISGDNVLTTQLDLARAYLETERKNLAKSILNNVLQHGSEEQRQEAQRMLGDLQTAT
jgi:FimV-like protein